MALERVPGVDSADVSYESGRAVVAYDATVTSPDEFIAELERMTGYVASLEAGGAPGNDPPLREESSEEPALRDGG